MNIFTGKSDDGSDGKEAPVFYISSNGEEWSNFPYEKTKEEKKFSLSLQKITSYCARKKITILDAHQEIINKDSGLSKSCRIFLEEYIKNGPVVER